MFTTGRVLLLPSASRQAVPLSRRHISRALSQRHGSRLYPNRASKRVTTLEAARPFVAARQSSTGASGSKPKTGPVHLYDSLVADGKLRKDDFQRSVTDKLQVLHNEVAAYQPPDIPEPVEYTNFININRWRNKPAAPTVPQIPPEVPKGIYLYGDVGCGKTMLMDLFYNTLPESVSNSKRRVHFHAFMEDVHKRSHQMSKEHGPGQDVIVPIARQLAREARVLCFDEFQVLDIVDAMILRRLFESLMGYGVVCVITSNRPPDDLYKNGIQRQSFVPCIDLIKRRFEVIDLDSGLDYRKIPRKTTDVYYHPITPENRAELETKFESLVEESRVQHDTTLTVWGRPIAIPESSPSNGGVARFTFKQLCAQALSASDYLEITKNFQHIFVTDIPQLTLDSRDQARRFIVFIDTCYENKTKLYCLSDPPILQVFAGEGGRKDGQITDAMRSAMDDLGLSADQVGQSSIFSSDEEIFAFARAVSRLSEMGTQAWSQSIYYA